jgi:hypothetical protein
MLVSKIRGIVADYAKTYDLLKSYTKFKALQANGSLSGHFIPGVHTIWRISLKTAFCSLQHSNTS